LAFSPRNSAADRNVSIKIVVRSKGINKMRFPVSILFYFTVLAVSCTKTNSSIIPNGIYSGTFQRLTDTGGLISNVSITFFGNTWTGQSEYEKYPALCHGSYEKNADSVTFQNACPWTTEFDWSLILGGNYKMTLSGNNLELTRSYSSRPYTDIYILVRE